LKLELIGFTPHLEEIVATAILTTTRRSRPSRIFRSLLEDAERVRGLIEGLSLQHRSVLEHNRVNYLLEASGEEVLELLLWSKFFDVTRLGEGLWLVSTNLKEIVRAILERGPMWRELLRSMEVFAPNLFHRLEGELREG